MSHIVKNDNLGEPAMAMKKIDRICATCKWWEAKLEDTEQPIWGECHASLPQTPGETIWPETLSTDWCGAHRRNDNEQ